MRYPLRKYRVTQGFSARHTGIDLAAARGTTVYAAVTGKVIAVGTNPSYVGGRYVIIREDSKNHYEYYTGHHSTTSVKVGQHIKEGQPIATVGSTGVATGPHVHFQVRKYGYGALMNPITVYKYYNPSGIRKVVNPKPLPRRQAKVYYIVKFGDSVDKLSTKWGLDKRKNYQGFRRLNPGIINVNLIQRGQKVRVR